MVVWQALLVGVLVSFVLVAVVVALGMQLEAGRFAHGVTTDGSSSEATSVDVVVPSSEFGGTR